MKNNKMKIIFTLIAIIIFIYHMFNIFYHWADIPKEIAIHFTGGEPDQWGPKYILLIMPLFSIVVYFLIGLLVKRPEKLNYVNLTEANKEIQYNRMQSVLILIQNFSFAAFIFANEAFLNSAIGLNTNLFFTIAIVLIVICLIAPIYLLIWAATLKY